jgi:hypothetical protein
MRSDAVDSADDPLEQDAPDYAADDPAIASWFLAEGDRANPATDLRAFTTGNLVQPLVDGRSYFARLCAELRATQAGDQVYFVDFRGELSIAVLDSEPDAREPRDPAGLGDGARVFARDLRLRLWREHLDRHPGDTADLLDPQEAFAAFRQQAQQLARWHRSGRSGSRPPGRVLPHQSSSLTSGQRLWATPLYRMVYDPDGRPWRDRVRGRL